jgi:hypothetical protein
MIELNTLRRLLLPSAERLLPRVHFAVEVQDRAYAGVIDMTVEETRAWFHEQDNTYANNLASLKYYQTENRRVYESGSYAYRDKGYFGKWQLHIRLFEYEGDKVAIFCHWEKSALIRPVDHYNSVGYDTSKGIDELHTYLRERQVSIDDSKPIDKITQFTS